MNRALFYMSIVSLLSACGGEGGDSNESPRPEPSNQAPHIVLSDYQKEIDLGKTLQLDASGSFDPEGENLSFSWSIVKKPIKSSLSITDGNRHTISITPDVAGSYIFDIKVCDVEASCITKNLDAISVISTPSDNTPPVALFELNDAYSLGDIVKLDASKSYDADGNEISYEWLLIQKPEGSNAQLTGVNTVISSIMPDVAGNYGIKLVVSDGLEYHQLTNTFNATKANLPPVSNAGKDIVTNRNILIKLNGSESFDPDGESVSYAWRVVEQPALANTIIATPTIANPSISLTELGVYTFALVVTDSSGANSEDTVQVEVIKENTPPVSNAGLAQSVIVGDVVKLDGSQSHDPDGDNISYQWAFVSKPDGSIAELYNANEMAPYFTPEVTGDYVVSLTVSDGKSMRLSATDTVTIKVQTKNAKPVAAINADTTVGLNKSVNLDGSSSSDADGDALRYEWKMVSKPARSWAKLSSTDTVTTDFIPDEVGIYIAELSVNDGTEASAPVRISIEAITIVDPIPAGSGVLIKSTYFYAVDENSGNLTLNSYSSACPSISAMDIAPNGKLMGVYNQSQGLWEMDPYRPTCIKVGEVPRPSSSVYSGMAIDDQGVIYVSDGNKLRQLANDGSLLQDYAYSGHVKAVTGIDFASNGKLYGYTYHNDGELVEIDPRSGVTTLVAKMELPNDVFIHDFYDIDIDTDDVLRVRSSYTKFIYRYDLNGKLLSSQRIDGLPDSSGFNAISYVK